MSDPTDPVRANEAACVPDHDLDDLAAAVAKLTADSRRQEETLSRLADDHARSDSSPTAGPPRPATDDAPSSAFILALDGVAYAKELTALSAWVHHLVLPVYGREITASRPWCPRWTEHPEAVARLHGLWLAWQQLTDIEAGPTGPATWHRDHLDPTLFQLRSPDGPFGACTTSPSRPHHRLLPAPASAATAGA